MQGAESIQVSGSLRQRTMTALALGLAVIAAILWLPTPAFALLMLVVLLLAGWEWCALSGLTATRWRSAYLALLTTGALLLWHQPSWHTAALSLCVLWWTIQTVRLARVHQVERIAKAQPWLLPSGLVVLLGPWIALVDLHREATIGPELVLFLMILVWTADSAAFFVGRRWGRVRLAPALSPGKTWAGVYGALFGASLCALAFTALHSLALLPALLTLGLCALVAMISIVGDLFESLLKRRRNMKDSGNLLPGHGGMLDRIDSMTAAAPLFALGIHWILA